MIMKMNVLLLAFTSVLSLAWTTDSKKAFTVSLELQGGECSDQLTLICRHNDVPTDPVWIHNGTAKDGQLLGTAFPGSVYLVHTSTEHRVTVSGMDSVQALNGYIFQCAYSIRGNITKSNAVKYLFIPPDFQPQLMKTDVVQSFSGRLCTLTYELAGYAEGVAKYPKCAGQFSVNFTVSPVADVSNITTGSIAQYNITNLERCTVYDTFARSYRGGQVMGTVYASDSVMTTPGTFSVGNVTFVASKVVNITIEEVSPDCPFFPTRWYNVTITGDDGAFVLMKQVEANSFTTFNGTVIITVLFDTPLAQGLFNVEVFKVVTVPVKELNEIGIPVDTERVQEWSSSNKVIGVFNPHLPPVTTEPSNPVGTGAAVGAGVAGVAAVLVGCFVCCCSCCVVCMCLCLWRRKKAQGYYTIGKPAENMNSYETVGHVLHRRVAEDAVSTEEGTSLWAPFAATEMHFHDVSLGLAEPEDDGVPVSDLLAQSSVDPPKDGLVEQSHQTGALPRDGLNQKQFKPDSASFNGEDSEVHPSEESVYEKAAEHSSNASLGKVADTVACTVNEMVIKVVESTEVVLESASRPDSPLQEGTHSMSSPLQDPLEEKTEMTVKLVVPSLLHITDTGGGGIKELSIQDEDRTAERTESDDNATTIATKETPVQFRDTPEVVTELLPMSIASVADFESGTQSGLPLDEAKTDEKESASTVAKPITTGDARVGLQSSHYAQIDFSQKGTVPAPSNELYNVVYTEIKK